MTVTIIARTYTPTREMAPEASPFSIEIIRKQDER
jgi:hypothetical protein